MSMRTRLATSTGTAIAAGALLAAPALAAPPPSASLVAAFPPEAAVSAAAGTTMAYGAPSFTNTPIYAMKGVPGAGTVSRSAEGYARSLSAGGVEVVSVFLAEHGTSAAARARVVERLRSDRGTSVTDPGIGSMSRTYAVEGGDIITRAAVGTVSLGAWVTGSKAAPATLRRVSQRLTRLMAQRTPAAQVAGPPVVPVYLQRVVPPTPASWESDGVVALGASTAAVQASPGVGALRTQGWGTFQYVMGLVKSTGATQVVASASHAAPPSASGLSLSTIGIPFGTVDAATGFVALLPKSMEKLVPVPIAVQGATSAMAMRPPSGRGVVARVASPRGDAIEVWCATQGTPRLGAGGVTRCADALQAQAQAWIALNARAG